MKTSYIIAIVFLMLVGNILSGIANGSDTIFSTTEGLSTTTMETLTKPELGDASSGMGTGESIIVGAGSFIKNAGVYFVTFINALFWNYPTLFEGNWMTVRLLMLIPITIAIVLSIVIIARGVSSG